MTEKKSAKTAKKSIEWTFLSNHSHVLICLNQNPEMLLREVALLVGITERAVQAIVRDLVEAKILKIEKEGRRNKYKIKKEIKLRHPLEAHHNIGELLNLGR
ncbi:hypothetical protein LPTSP4_16190 [Leptospira ryugenii]|uniref:ArsR family transcriptional regulator n=1 Tax=Leptospira ryugenii TaxID=1917863 RepID=A0A2P2DZP0_9LEPT|nr:winged helix-turn-helix transcriptional regulator [Leptospira ryugenii]GBF50095.1 hypothetical protein LPTSP4_16190 [Leptospira ryugenii]